MAVTKFEDIIKSPMDKRNYRGLVLENDLKVLLASEPGCEIAAASLSVAVGSMNDPVDLPGLAHLCEHMLFFESRNHLSKTEKLQLYAKFIAINGGSCNANTAKDQTNYHFDIASSHLKEGLTRFAKFFTETPAFPEAALEKEIKIVDSEFKSRLNNDAWRRSAAEACTAKAGHPFNNFSTGNYETLWNIPTQNSVNVLDRLKGFHDQYYSSNIMSLVILGKESLEELEQLATSLFSQIKNLHIALPTWLETPYGADQCGTRVDMFPVTNVRDLYVSFPIPDTRPFYTTYPQGYLTNLLGQKGPGSLFSFLHSKNWVNNSSVNATIPARGFGYFSVGLQLTIDGLDHIEEIIGYVFQYIKVLTDAGPQKYIWDELQTMSRNGFEFPDPDNPICFVQKMSSLIHVYPISSVLSVGYIITEYDAPLIQRYLDTLKPENCRIMTMTKNNKDVQSEEKWYGVKYNVHKLPSEKLEGWKTSPANSELKLPPANKFIPTNFSLKPRDESEPEKPVQVLNDGLNLLWFVHDKHLDIPKAFLRVELFSPLPMVDPESNIYNQLLWMGLNDSLSEELYGAGVAGLEYSIKGTMYGAELTVHGFDENLSKVTKTIFEKMFTLAPTQARLKLTLQAYSIALLSWAVQPLHSQVPYYMSLLLREKRFSNEELIKSLTTTKFHVDALDAYRSLFLSKLKVEWFITGNVTKVDALEIVESCNKIMKLNGTMPMRPCQTLRLREVDLKPGVVFSYRVERKTKKTSCCIVLLQIGTINPVEIILLELFDQIVRQPLFNQLRNQDNLGYVVRTSVRRVNGTQGYQILVQGEHHPSVVEKRINVFLSGLTGILHSLSDQDFNKHKDVLALRKKDVPKNLFTHSNRLWNTEIYTREYEFDRNEKELELLRTITKKQVKSFVTKYIHPESNERKCIVLNLMPIEDKSPPTTELEEKTNAENENPSNKIRRIEIKNITEWKTQLGLLPLFYLNWTT